MKALSTRQKILWGLVGLLVLLYTLWPLFSILMTSFKAPMEAIALPELAAPAPKLLP